MSLQPRCELSAVVNATAVPVALTGWTNAGAGVAGTAPAAGDLVVIVITSNGASDVVNQTAGTPWAPFDGNGNNNGGSIGLTTSCWYKIWEGTETAPTWTWNNGVRNTYTVMAITPDAGSMIFPDQWSAVKKDTAAATTHTPNTATVGTGYTDVSVVLAGACASASGATAFSYTATTNYTIPAGASVSNVGTSAQFVYGSSIEYAANRTSGTTVTPSAETISGGSGAGGTTQATMYHLLVRELQVSTYPFDIIQTAYGPAATSATFANPTTAGNGIVVILPLTNGGSTTVFPSVSAVTLGGAADHFTAVREQTVAGAANTYYAGIWADPDCAGGQTVVAITAANNSGGAATGVLALEVAGLGIAPAIKSSVDKTAGTSGTSTAPSSGATAATAEANELLVGAYSGGFGLSAIAGPSGAGGNVGLFSSSTMEGGAYAFATATGTATFSGTQKGSYGWAAVVATFVSGSTAHPAALATSASFPAPVVTTLNPPPARVITILSPLAGSGASPGSRPVFT